MWYAHPGGLVPLFVGSSVLVLVLLVGVLRERVRVRSGGVERRNSAGGGGGGGEAQERLGFVWRSCGCGWTGQFDDARDGGRCGGV